MASIHNCLEFFDGFEFLDGFDSQQPRATSTASSDLSFNSFTGLLNLNLIDGLDLQQPRVLHNGLEFTTAGIDGFAFFDGLVFFDGLTGLSDLGSMVSRVYATSVR